MTGADNKEWEPPTPSPRPAALMLLSALTSLGLCSGVQVAVAMIWRGRRKASPHYERAGMLKGPARQALAEERPSVVLSSSGAHQTAL